MSTRLADSSRPALPARRRPGGDSVILLAASLWGTTGTVRTLAPADASSISVGAARIALGGAVLVIVAACTARGAGLRRLLTSGRRNLTLLGLGAGCVAIYQTAYFTAVGRTGVATATVVTIGSAPAFAGLLALLTGGARPTWRWLAGTGCAVAGCGALVGGGESAGVEPLGIALALLSGVGYALYATIVSRLITGGQDDRAVAAALFGLAALILLPVLLAGSPGWLGTGSGLLITCYLGVVTTGLGYLLYARGLRTTPVATATTLTLAEPAVAAVLGLVVLGERLGGTATAGLGLVAVGLVLAILPERR